MRRGAALLAGLLLVAACGSDPDDRAAPGPPAGALGGSDETVLLAEASVDGLPDAPLAWTAHVVGAVEHAHAPAFVHARTATSLRVEGDERPLPARGAAFVPGGVAHRHGAGEAWDVLLAAPGTVPPGAGARVFISEQLVGVPRGAVRLSSYRVTLPAGAQTSVHTHPGPEHIVVTGGRFDYENALVGALDTDEGDGHTVPAGTAVQKRNPPGRAPAEFLSWFIVDPAAPFAPPATFTR